MFQGQIASLRSLMSLLPMDRVTALRPLTHCRVDYAEPILIREGKRWNTRHSRHTCQFSFVLQQEPHRTYKDLTFETLSRRPNVSYRVGEILSNVFWQWNHWAPESQIKKRMIFIVRKRNQTYNNFLHKQAHFVELYSAKNTPLMGSHQVGKISLCSRCGHIWHSKNCKLLSVKSRHSIHGPLFH